MLEEELEVQDRKLTQICTRKLWQSDRLGFFLVTLNVRSVCDVMDRGLLLLGVL